MLLYRYTHATYRLSKRLKPPYRASCGARTTFFTTSSKSTILEDEKEQQTNKIIDNDRETLTIKMSFEVLRSSVRHPGFWILSLTFFICGLTSNGLISQHFVAFCSDINIGIVVASSILSIDGCV